jgi:LmbE family N-acetylglucosaminyl deacetylase
MMAATPERVTVAAVAVSLLMPFATRSGPGAADQGVRHPARSATASPLVDGADLGAPVAVPATVAITGATVAARATDVRTVQPGPRRKRAPGASLMLRLRRLARAVLRWAARDMTAATTTRSALVIAPHPDDETLGCGATIARKVAAGTPVTILVVSDGRYSHRSAHISPERLAALRRDEMLECAARLGLAPEDVRWAGFVDGDIAEREDDLMRLIGTLIAELRPQEIYATSPWEGHADHAVVGRATRRALAGSGCAATLFEYPVWLWDTWPLRRGARITSLVQAMGMAIGRRVHLVRTDSSLPTKLHALQAHASQLRRPPAVPEDEEWPVLPPAVLANVADSVELFLRPRAT